MSGWILLGLLVLAWWCFTSSSGKSRSSRPASAGMGRGLSRKRECSVCGYSAVDIAAHEAGHVAAAEKLGYQVQGAIVFPGEGGYTRVPGWTNDPWDTMVIAAAGASGENRDRMFFEAEINGSKSTEGSDAWWCHQNAPEVAARLGVTPAKAVQMARAEADRIVAANSGRWKQAWNILERDHRFGDVD